MNMKQKRILFFTAPALVLVVAIILASPFKQKTTGFGKLSPSFESDSVTFWVSGDAMMHMPQYKAAYNDAT